MLSAIYRRRRFRRRLADRYINQVLPSVPGLGPGPYRLEGFHAGTLPTIFKLIAASGENHVIRFYPGRKYYLADLCRGYHAFLTSHGIPCPKLIYADRSVRTRWRFGFDVFVEEFIDGAPYYGRQMDRSSVTSALGDLIGRFHQISSPAHGLPWQPDPRPSRFDVMLEAASDFHDNIARRIGAIDPAEINEAMRWLEGWRPLISSFRPYQLIHGDLNGGNVIIQPDGSPRLIDFRLTHFGYFEEDVVFAHNYLLGGDADRIATFMARWVSHVGQGALERLERTRPFFQCWLRLPRISNHATKIQKTLQGRRRDDLRCQQEQLQKLMGEVRAMMRNQQPPSP
jgi:aminoglycoside phosphotransferase (APT) family kinase protein